MNWIENVKASASIKDIVSRYVRVIKHNMVRCPFHNDKTPSMSIDVHKNMFYCFGCGEGGDPIRFVERMENLSFIDACAKIAEIYHIPIEKSTPNPLPEIAEQAHYNLFKSETILHYVKKRGISIETIKTFKLGLLDNIEINKKLEQFGLNSKLAYIMKGRLIFPIYSNKVCIALGGRAINGEQPKYINTGESEIFKKRRTLYGHARYADSIWLVEGYMDVLTCYQKGLNVVAPLGTSISDEHIEICWKYAPEIVLCMDNDLAGRNATDRTIKKALSIIRPGYRISVAILPNNEDPDSFLHRNDVKEIQIVPFTKYWWQIYDPKAEKSPEMCVVKYKQLLSLVECVRDKDLKYAYIQEWKKLWFAKKSTPNRQIEDPVFTYPKILLSIPYHFPKLLNHICDYLMSIDLPEDLHSVREYIIFSTNQNTVDEKDKNMLDLNRLILDINQLKILAPFCCSVDKIADGWFEMFERYKEVIRRRKLTCASKLNLKVGG